MDPTQIAARYPPASDVARRCPVVVCPRCGKRIRIPKDASPFSWYAPHTPVHSDLDRPYAYCKMIAEPHRYALRTGEEFWIWLPQVSGGCGGGDG